MDFDIFYYLIQGWIALMLSVQSVILYKLLPEIKKVSKNSDVFNIFKRKENQK